MDYKIYRQKNITVEKLDELMEWVVNSATGKVGAIIAGFKILICFAYLYTRNKLIETQMEIDKQQLAQDIAEDAENNVEVVD